MFANEQGFSLLELLLTSLVASLLILALITFSTKLSHYAQHYSMLLAHQNELVAIIDRLDADVSRAMDAGCMLKGLSPRVMIEQANDQKPPNYSQGEVFAVLYANHDSTITWRREGNAITFESPRALVHGDVLVSRYCHHAPILVHNQGVNQVTALAGDFYQIPLCNSNKNNTCVDVDDVAERGELAFVTKVRWYLRGERLQLYRQETKHPYAPQWHSQALTHNSMVFKLDWLELNRLLKVTLSLGQTSASYLVVNTND